MIRPVSPLLRRQTIVGLRTALSVQIRLGNHGAADMARHRLMDALDKPIVADQVLLWRSTVALELARNAGRVLAQAQAREKVA